MRDETLYDLLIIGGGINGAGIARDAAGRGLKVALVEMDDLASHTSSASTKLIHGGLRYLEYYEFALVREALAEREVMLRIAPHLVREMEFILPHNSDLRPAWLVRAGLFLYDHLDWSWRQKRRIGKSRQVDLQGEERYGKALKGQYQTGFSYRDCWVDDSRLVALNVLDAAERGATVLTRTRLVRLTPEGDCWRAATEANGPGGVSTEIRARACVNAAGPWVQEVAKSLAGIAPKGQSRLVKGSHVILPRLFAGEHAYMFQNHDRRIIFALPYEDEFTLIGTTDLDFEGDPGAPEITKKEIAYLCKAAGAYLAAEVKPEHVAASYSGVRPLYDDGAGTATDITREYVLELDRAGGPQGPALLSVFGGKITTYRRLAEEALDKLAPALGKLASAWTAKGALPGGDMEGGDAAAFEALLAGRYNFLPAPHARRLARSYGTRALRFLAEARQMSDLGRDYGAGFTEAELDYLRTHEFARGAEDVLRRRSKLYLHLPLAAQAALSAQFTEQAAGAA
jgi:glycerol-3-phosphate dehydrogenase